jgi:hypothetical protein
MLEKPTKGRWVPMQDNLSQEHRTALNPHSAAHALTCKDADLIPSDAPQHVHCVAHDEQNDIARYLRRTML